MSLAAHPERWLPLLGYRGDTRGYRLLDAGCDHEVWVVSWLPGQGTDLHDHGPASGAFAVAAGTLTERVVTSPHSAPVNVIRQLAAGRVRAFGPYYGHQVSNPGTVPAVSLHVYAQPLPRDTVACGC
ncbi:MAG: cysteine dioxygenase [Pseudonocardiaceae bacterium]|nr:cysteine dioxygenase [Pseudonocardiaceae bacterium]